MLFRTCLLLVVSLISSTTCLAQRLYPQEKDSSSFLTSATRTTTYSRVEQPDIVKANDVANSGRDSGLNVSFFYSDSCTNLTTEFFWKAYHPGENSRKKVARGSLNEDTPGRGYNCYISKTWYIHGAQLVNSQKGLADLFSIGGTLTPIDVWGLSAHVHLEAGWLNYEVPRFRAVKSGVIPLMSFELRYKLTEKFGSLGLREYRLPAEGIKLYSFTWDIPINIKW